jgi:phage-related protein
MPRLVLFRRADGTVPLLEWLRSLPDGARDTCVLRLELLGNRGHLLRLPHADHVGSGIHELRAKHRGVNLRMFYFLHGRATVVLTHGICKQESRIPPAEIMRALKAKAAFELSPEVHTHERPT